MKAELKDDVEKSKFDLLQRVKQNETDMESAKKELEARSEEVRTLRRRNERLEKENHELLQDAGVGGYVGCFRGARSAA
jgi:hypothetical protein